jgi:hypothetical protein
VLARHFPEVPRHDDVSTAVQWWQSQPRPRVDLVTAPQRQRPREETAGRQGVAPAVAPAERHDESRPLIESIWRTHP